MQPKVFNIIKSGKYETVESACHGWALCVEKNSYLLIVCGSDHAVAHEYVKPG